MGVEISGLRFRVERRELKVKSLGFMASGVAVRVGGGGVIRVKSLEFRPGFGFQV